MLFENQRLLDIYHPGPPKLAPHNKALALALASVSTAKTDVPTIETLRESVATFLDGKTLTYPNSINSQSYMLESIGDMPCYLLRAKNPVNVPTIIMFYGGGFCLNTLDAHKAFMANIIALTPCHIVLPNYPLAPETKAPESFKLLSHFLQDLLTHPNNFNLSDNIILMGWSSGGHMALSQTLHLQKIMPQLFKKITKLILLSPWMDLSLNVARTGPYQFQQNSDTIAAGHDILALMAKWYLPEGYDGSETPYCPALYAKEVLKVLPPVTIIAGGCEVLLGDSVFITDKLQEAGAKVQFVALEGQTHNYLVFDTLSRDGVFVPALLSRIITNQSFSNMLGEDGFGLTIQTYHMLNS